MCIGISASPVHIIALKVRDYSGLKLTVSGSVRDDHSHLSCLPTQKPGITCL